MNMAKLIARLSRYIAVVGMGLGAAMFWGTVAAVIAKVVFGLEEAHAWIFVGLPVAAVFLAWIWKKLPGILGLVD